MNNICGLENINESLSTHYTVYKIINNINGKYYVGLHKTTNILEDIQKYLDLGYEFYSLNKGKKFKK